MLGENCISIGWKKACCNIFAAVIIIVFSNTASAEERQYKLEAAFLYSFFNYITWPGLLTPQDLQKPIVCVYGEDPIIPYLVYISNRMSDERTLTIKTINNPESIIGCNIFFIRHRMSQAIEESTPRDTLVVFKPDDPLDSAGMIELAQDGERISIRIDQSRLEHEGFQVSSRLLDLARKAR